MYKKGTQMKQVKSRLKYKYVSNQPSNDLNMSSSFDQRLGVSRVQQPTFTFPEKIKSNSNFSTGKSNIGFSDSSSSKITLTVPKKSQKSQKIKQKEKFKLPYLKKSLSPNNPQQRSVLKKTPQNYYQSKIFRALKYKQNTYLMNLARQHFIQSVEAIKVGRNIKLNMPKQLKLNKKNPKLKTIFLDLDQTLIHCDQFSANYTVKLNFPIQGGGFIPAGIRVRPFCHQFIKDLSEFAQVIIFTASASSYADVVLDYLDPQKKYFSHRLYRQHCTLQKGFYTKDLRIANRRPQDVAIVDNSAFSFMTQPEFGIPVLPFYHFAKDRQLIFLLQYLKKLVQQVDMRQNIKKTFFWQSYRKNQQDPRKILRLQYEDQKQITI